MDRDDASLGAFLSLLAASARPSTIARAIATGPLVGSALDLVLVHGLVDQVLELRGQYGLLGEQRRLCAKLPLSSPTPHVEVLRSGLATFWDAQELLRDFPMMHRLQLPTSGEFLLLPLQMAARPLGVMSLHSSRHFERSWDLHERVAPIASALALWLQATVGEPREAPLPDARLRITTRQRHVLAAVRSGLSNAAIASELGFSIGTIKADITAMSALFGAVGRHDLERKAARAGF